MIKTFSKTGKIEYLVDEVQREAAITVQITASTARFVSETAFRRQVPEAWMGQLDRARSEIAALLTEAEEFEAEACAWRSMRAEVDSLVSRSGYFAPPMRTSPPPATRLSLRASVTTQRPTIGDWMMSNLGLIKHDLDLLLPYRQTGRAPLQSLYESIRRDVDARYRELERYLFELDGQIQRVTQEAHERETASAKEFHERCQNLVDGDFIAEIAQEPISLTRRMSAIELEIERLKQLRIQPQPRPLNLAAHNPQFEIAKPNEQHYAFYMGAVRESDSPLSSTEWRSAIDSALKPWSANSKSEPFQLPNRERIPTHIRRAVWNRDKGRCAHCGSRDRLEYDHIVPVSRGGSNTERNIELLCEACNRTKSNGIR